MPSIQNLLHVNMAEHKDEEIKKLRKQHQDHVLIQFAKQKDIADTLVPFDHGEKCNFWDMSGNKWIDFCSQLFNLQLGHQHPKVGATNTVVLIIF